MQNDKGLKTSYDNKEVFFIVPFKDGYDLYVEPAYRHNGTQAYDGRFPRHYKKVGAAKASLTKFLGKPEKWEEL
jgi:hypothetical protein